MDRTIVRDPSCLEPVPWNRSRAVVLVVPVSSGYILITYLHGRHDHGHGPVEVVERRSKSTGCEALLSVGTDYRSLELESPRSGRSTAYYTKKERDSELFWSLRGSRKRREREGWRGACCFRPEATSRPSSTGTTTNATAGDEASNRAIGARLVASTDSSLNLLSSFLLPPSSFSFISRIRRRFLHHPLPTLYPFLFGSKMFLLIGIVGIGRKPYRWSWQIEMQRNDNYRRCVSTFLTKLLTVYYDYLFAVDSWK